MRKAGFAALAFMAAPLPADAGYDASWYRAHFWSGEYPGGFTVTEPVSIRIRTEPAPESARTIECSLAEKATYHPWNAERVKTDGLEFLSFTRIAEMTVKNDMTVRLATGDGSSEVEARFAAGDKWRYLAYLAEGDFLMEHGGRRLIGNQSLFDNSTAPWPRQGEETYHEWLKLTCANGAAGWILISEVINLHGIDLPNVIGYGDARDLGK
jgi:hypothetical protein